MATDLENLAAIRSGYLVQLAVDAASSVPQPSYSLDGESLSRTEWRNALMDRVKVLTEAIVAEQPFEIRTQAL